VRCGDDGAVSAGFGVKLMREKSTAFLKKSSKKLLLLVHLGHAAIWPFGLHFDNPKFFADFFQNGSVCLFPSVFT
jgi:hypothetical protein